MSYFNKRNPYLDGQNRGSNSPYIEQVLRVPKPEIIEPAPSQGSGNRDFTVDFDINKDKE